LDIVKGEDAQFTDARSDASKLKLDGQRGLIAGKNERAPIASHQRKAFFGSTTMSIVAPGGSATRDVVSVGEDSTSSRETNT
jgi:hypothetical protein